MFLRIYFFIRDETEMFALWLASIMSWPLWIPAILALSTLAIVMHWMDVAVYILTVQTAIDASATKTMQSHLRAIDQRRDAMLQETVENTSAIVFDMKRQNDTLYDMMLAAERRDRLAAKRDKMILTALESRADFVEFLMKGGALNDRTRKTARRPGPNRKANGRANRKRS